MDIFRGMFRYFLKETESLAKSYSSKKLFLKVSQISHERTFDEVLSYLIH